MNLHILIPNLDCVIIPPFNLIVKPQFCDQLAHALPVSISFFHILQNLMERKNNIPHLADSSPSSLAPCTRL